MAPQDSGAVLEAALAKSPRGSLKHLSNSLFDEGAAETRTALLLVVSPGKLTQHKVINYGHCATSVFLVNVGGVR